MPRAVLSGKGSAVVLRSIPVVQCRGGLEGLLIETGKQSGLALIQLRIRD
ncbi:MAG TPA: hypothetical protein VF221_14335 [Chloroflexota bacterium]